jgi:hypothetical protein
MELAGRGGTLTLEHCGLERSQGCGHVVAGHFDLRALTVCCDCSKGVIVCGRKVCAFFSKQALFESASVGHSRGRSLLSLGIRLGRKVGRTGRAFPHALEVKASLQAGLRHLWRPHSHATASCMTDRASGVEKLEGWASSDPLCYTCVVNPSFGPCLT